MTTRSALALSRRRLLQVGTAVMAVTAPGVFSMRSARADSGRRAHILHINDMHSRIDHVAASDGTCGGRALEEQRWPGWPPPSAPAALRCRRPACRS
jgi:5'-nucleotidase